MNKLLLLVIVAQMNFSFAQVIQNGVSTPPVEELKEDVPTTTSPAVKKESSVADKQFKNAESDMQQIESAVSTYSISRNAAKQSRTSRTPSTYNQSQMDNSVDVLEKAAPNSYEFHIYSYIAGNYDVDLIDHLNKAEKLQANSFDVLSQKAAYHLIKSESKSALSYLQKLVDNKKITKDVLNYAEDLLRSVPKNGVLITHGFDDSYATSYLQLKKSIRTDVTIISLDFLQSEYLQKQLKSKLINIPDRKAIDVEYLKKFVELNDKLKITIATTVPKEYLTGISSKLFITGLVFTYSNVTDFDNYTVNKDLWSNELKKSGINDVTTDKGKQLSANYLPMLLQLANSSKKLNQSVSEYDKAIEKIAKQCNKTEQVKKLKTY